MTCQSLHEFDLIIHNPTFFALSYVFFMHILQSFVSRWRRNHSRPHKFSFAGRRRSPTAR